MQVAGFEFTSDCYKARLNFIVLAAISLDQLGRDEKSGPKSNSIHLCVTIRNNKPGVH